VEGTDVVERAPIGSAAADVGQPLGAVVNREDMYLVIANETIDDAIRPLGSNSGTTRPDFGKSFNRSTARISRATMTEA
jgi:hypothetical protein